MFLFGRAGGWRGVPGQILIGLNQNNLFVSQLGAAYSLTLIMIACFQLKVFRLGFTLTGSFYFNFQV